MADFKQMHGMTIVKSAKARDMNCFLKDSKDTGTVLYHILPLGFNYSQIFNVLENLTLAIRNNHSMYLHPKKERNPLF